MSVVYGLYRQTEGEIVVDGRTVEIDSPSDAIELGIGMVHQHFMLVPVMTVAENIVLGQEPSRRGVLDLKSARARVRELSDRYGLAVDPDAVDRGRHGRHPAARRDPQGALPGRPDPGPRRADGGADRAGGARADRRAEPAQGGRHRDRVHLSQARRGAAGRRPDHRPAARQEGRHGAAGGRDRAQPRSPRGRSRRAARGREAADEPRARRCSRSRI